MALTFRKLEVFVAVAQLGNFRKAAESLGISQPSVSSQIKSMERFLGYPLFVRHRGAISELSVEGRDFLSRAVDLVAAQSALTAERRENVRPLPLALRIALGPMLLAGRIRSTLERFQETSMRVALVFVETIEGDDVVRRGEADVLLSTGSVPESCEGAATEVISHLSCSLYGAPALVRPVLQGQKALGELPFLQLPDKYRFAHWAQRQFDRQGFAASQTPTRVPDFDSLLPFLLAGKGVAPYFDVELATHLRAGRVLPCGPALDPVAVFMVTSELARTPEAAPLLSFLRNAIRTSGEIGATHHAQVVRPGGPAPEASLAAVTGM